MSLEHEKTLSDVCAEWKRDFTRSTEPLGFEIIYFLCFVWKILLKVKTFVNQEGLLFKLSIETVGRWLTSKQVKDKSST